MMRSWILSLAGLVAACGAIVPNAVAAPAARLGAERVVFDWSRDACERRHIPDAAARAYRFRGRVHLIAPDYIGRRMTGPTLNRLEPDCHVIMRSSYSPRPGAFDDRSWIAATYALADGRVYALVHNEYQGHEHPGRCSSGRYLKCWFNAITLAVSNNGGRSFHHARPPGHLVATIPYRYRQNRGPAGLFSPSNIIRNPADGQYYAFVRATPYEQQPLGVCLMRTSNLDNSVAWRAWGGAGFDVTFVNPYVAGPLIPAQHICHPIARRKIAGMSDSLTFNTYLGRYLLVGASGLRNRTTGHVTWGFYYSLSTDLVHWTKRRLLMRANLTFAYRCGGGAPALYPSLIDPSSPSRNFSTTGRRPYLYFTRFHYKRCHQTYNRDLVRRRVTFRR
jgi:hypothetical protein